MADQDGHRLGGATSAPPNAPGPTPDGGQPHAVGPKLSVDFGEANQALTHLEAAINLLDQAYQASVPMEQIRNPGRETPSTGFAGAANPIGKQKRAEIDNQRATLRAMHDNLQAQLQSQRRTEEVNATNLRQARS